MMKCYSYYVFLIYFIYCVCQVRLCQVIMVRFQWFRIGKIFFSFIFYVCCRVLFCVCIFRDLGKRIIIIMNIVYCFVNGKRVLECLELVIKRFFYNLLVRVCYMVLYCYKSIRKCIWLCVWKISWKFQVNSINDFQLYYQCEVLVQINLEGCMIKGRYDQGVKF